MPPASSGKNPGKKPPPKQGRQYSPGMIVVVTVAVVAVVALIVVVVTQLSGGGKETEGLSQTQPVAVEGTPLVQFPQSGADPAVGQAAPALEGKSFDGSSVFINPADGKAKVLVFFAHWCPHCQAEVPRIVQWSKEGKVPANVSVYGVSTGTDSRQPNYPPSSWLKEVGWPYPTLADSTESAAARAYGLSAYPYFVALDSSGKVVQRTTGELTEEQFTALLASVTPPG